MRTLSQRGLEEFTPQKFARASPCEPWRNSKLETGQLRESPSFRPDSVSLTSTSNRSLQRAPMVSAVPFATKVNPLPWLAVYTEPQLDRLNESIQVLPTLFRILAALCFLPVAFLAFVSRACYLS